MNMRQQAAALRRVVNEVVKANADIAWEDFWDREEAFKTAGFEVVGKGYFSVAYSHRKYPDVILKVTRPCNKNEMQDGFPLYVRFLRETKIHSRLAIKVFSLCHHGGKVTTAVSERLEKHRMPYSKSKTVIDARFHTGTRERAPNYIDPRALSFVRKLNRFAKRLNRKAKLDLHDENIMLRPGTGDIVISDPLTA